MKFHSLNDKSMLVSAKEAILNGMAQDGSLYMPVSLPDLSPQLAVWDETTSCATIAKTVAAAFFSEEISQTTLDAICEAALPFDTPLSFIDNDTAILELFHGPTLAFKDIGARFLARFIPALTTDSNKITLVIVATSGDTGGAVADAFFEVPQTRVVVLYPANGVSKSQESQFASLGKNIQALKVDGTFDDCQRIAKILLADSDLKATYNLISANSINIARLIPQSTYYIRAWLLARAHGWKEITFCVPSGNFGNITAGTVAKHMGLPKVKFIAATNANATVPDFFKTGNYQPKPSVATLSNAMDVGSPSNFHRWYSLFENSLENLKVSVDAFAISEDETVAMIKRFQQTHNAPLDPHTAVALAACEQYRRAGHTEPVIVLGTAHPAKFREVIEKITGIVVSVPDSIQKVLNKPILAKQVAPDAKQAKSIIISV